MEHHVIEESIIECGSDLHVESISMDPTSTVRPTYEIHDWRAFNFGKKMVG